MAVTTLTDPEYWDEMWSKVVVPREMRKTDSQYVYEILDIFDRYLPHSERLSVLEVGGAPGQYVAYLNRALGYEPHVLELSKVGCEKTAANFELLGISGLVHEGDLFSDDLDLPTFDVVYSLGLIEHFTDTREIVDRHLRLLKPGGFLVLGCPNFLGINGAFLKRLAPKLYSMHDLHVMDIRNWKAFEEYFGLESVFRGYVGGLEPSVFARTENASARNQFVVRVAKRLGRLLNRERYRGFRRFNSRVWSGYLMAVYRSPRDRPSKNRKSANGA